MLTKKPEYEERASKITTVPIIFLIILDKIAALATDTNVLSIYISSIFSIIHIIAVTFMWS